MTGPFAHDERVSAYLDDEMEPAQRAAFVDEMASSPELRAEVRSLGALRGALRELPEVEPPFDVVAEGRRRRRRAAARRRARPLVAVVAIAAAWMAVLAFGAGTALPRVVPALDDLVEAHAAAATGAPSGFAEMDMASMAGDTPRSLGHGMALSSVYARGDVVLYSYSDGDHTVSVFTQEGVVDWDAMPADGEMAAMADDSKAWKKTMEGTEVMVVDSGATVLTVVADPGTAEMAEMAVEMTDAASGSGLAERIRRAAGDVVELFGFG